MQGQAGRDELIAELKWIERFCQFGVTIYEDGRLLQRVRSILEREPPILVPCGVCGEPVILVEIKRESENVWRCRCDTKVCGSIFHCVEIVAATKHEAILISNAANAAIREMMER